MKSLLWVFALLLLFSGCLDTDGKIEGSSLDISGAVKKGVEVLEKQGRSAFCSAELGNLKSRRQQIRFC